VIDDVDAAEAARKATVLEALLRPPAKESETARAKLERLLGPDELARVDERLLALVTADQAEPEPAFFDALGAHQAEKRRRLHDALLCRATPEATKSSRRVASFDGGRATLRRSPRPTRRR
jgi:hypothetical protein